MVIDLQPSKNWIEISLMTQCITVNLAALIMSLATSWCRLHWLRIWPLVGGIRIYRLGGSTCIDGIHTRPTGGIRYWDICQTFNTHMALRSPEIGAGQGMLCTFHSRGVRSIFSVYVTIIVLIFLATLVALHFTPVTGQISTSVALRLASLFCTPLF